jgi:hypothetical protein
MLFSKLGYSHIEHELRKGAVAADISLQLSGRDNVLATGSAGGDVTETHEWVVLATI